MLWSEKGVNWNDFPIYQKRGSCCIRLDDYGWIVDREIPIFVNEGRDYIEKLDYKEETTNGKN